MLPQGDVINPDEWPHCVDDVSWATEPQVDGARHTPWDHGVGMRRLRCRWVAYMPS